MSENELMISTCAAIDINLDSDVKFNLLEKFPNLSKDEKARISLVAFDTAENKNAPMFKLSQFYYIEIDKDNSVSFAAPKSKEFLSKLIAKYGEPKVRLVTIVVRYVTDKHGTIVKNAQGHCDFTFYAWLISPDKFQALKTMHNEWNLYKRDMIIALDAKSDPKFQNLVLQPAQECAWDKHPDAASVVEQARAFYAQTMLKYIPKELTEEEIAIKLGWDVGAPVANAANPFGNPQQQITAQAGVATEANPFSQIVKPS